jgi:hypothetical protein
LVTAFPSAAIASKWEVHWAVQNNIGGGIQLLLPPQQPTFLANLSISVCARCSDGNYYNVRYVAGEATGGRHAWDPIMRRLNPDDDEFHDVGCAGFVFVTLASTVHSLPAAAEFAPRASGVRCSSGTHGVCCVIQALQSGANGWAGKHGKRRACAA